MPFSIVASHGGGVSATAKAHKLEAVNNIDLTVVHRVHSTFIALKHSGHVAHVLKNFGRLACVR